jgi:hypothetical protein
MMTSGKESQAVRENLFQRANMFSFDHRRERQETLPTLCKSTAIS